MTARPVAPHVGPRGRQVLQAPATLVDGWMTGRAVRLRIAGFRLFSRSQVPGRASGKERVEFLPAGVAGFQAVPEPAYALVGAAVGELLRVHEAVRAPLQAIISDGI